LKCSSRQNGFSIVTSSTTGTSVSPTVVVFEPEFGLSYLLADPVQQFVARERRRDSGVRQRM
jgi:hypothetical protein